MKFVDENIEFNYKDVEIALNFNLSTSIIPETLSTVIKLN